MDDQSWSYELPNNAFHGYFKAAKFCAELRRVEGHQAWIVGIVEDGEGTATVIERPRIIEVVTGDDGSVQVINNQSPIRHLSIHMYSAFLDIQIT